MITEFVAADRYEQIDVRDDLGGLPRVVVARERAAGAVPAPADDADALAAALGDLPGETAGGRDRRRRRGALRRRRRLSPMRYATTRAVVLSSRPLGEADRWLTLFTREQGRSTRSSRACAARARAGAAAWSRSASATSCSIAAARARR